MRNLLILLAVTTIVAAPARAARFDISPAAGESRIVFESKAPMESFEGKTGRVSGSIDLDTGEPDAIAIRVAVDMASLDTGIAMRNHHMCENHLHTDRFPEAVFEGAKVVDGDAASLGQGGDHDVTLEGDFTLHGVTRTIRVPARIAVQSGSAPHLHLTSEFEVALADYEIPRPRMLMLKLNEVQKVRVDLWAAPGTGSDAPAESAAAAGTP